MAARAGLGQRQKGEQYVESKPVPDGEERRRSSIRLRMFKVDSIDTLNHKTMKGPLPTPQTARRAPSRVSAGRNAANQKKPPRAGGTAQESPGDANGRAVQRFGAAGFVPVTVPSVPEARRTATCLSRNIARSRSVPPPLPRHWMMSSVSLASCCSIFAQTRR